MARGFSTLFGIGLLACASAGLTQEPETPTVTPERERILDAEQVEAFVDGYMASYLEEANIAGVTVSVVEGDALVLAKGYGHADVTARTPVDPETSLFRIGSVSKLFVWTSVMQLVEQGRLDLDADINDYLTDLRIPEAFGKPITMAELMTHTAGLDERVLGLFADDETALRPLGDILREELPPRVRTGGELTSYSNHGTGLAMYVVEQITGVPWLDYIQQNILDPLGMGSTTFVQPLPDELEPHMSKGYRFTNGELVEAPFELVPLAPVGAAASSATDMARFLATHLALGRYRDERILEEATARRMQRTLFRHHPSINGMAYGFMEMEWNGQRIIGHGGDTELFHTLFAFFPAHDIGLFASFNTAGASYMPLLGAFVDWRFPANEDRSSTVQSPSGLGRFAGTYRPTRFPHETIAKLSALISAFEVRAEEDHLVTSVQGKRHWYPVEPLLFQERGSSATIAFRETDDGRVTHLFLSEIPVVAFERAPVVETPKMAYAVLGGGLGIMFVAVLFWPVSAWIRWHYGTRLEKERRVPAFGRWSAWLGSLALVSFAVGLAVILSDPMKVVYGLSASARSVFWLPLAAVVFTLAALLGVLQAWRGERGSFLGRLAFTLLTIAMALHLWQLEVWNLLEFHY